MTRQSTIHLPAPLRMVASLSDLLTRRRSRRNLGPPLPLEALATVLWSAGGLRADGRRTAPSAGGTYPVDIALACGGVGGLPDGTYLYGPRHELVLLLPGDRRESLARAAIGQRFVAEAPATLVFAWDEGRIRPRYGPRSLLYAAEEVGHMGQGVYLASEALGLGTVAVGAFDPAAAAAAVGLRGVEVLYLFPVGTPRS